MTTAGDLMTTAIPRITGDQTVAGAMESLRSSAWAEVGHVYLVDEKAQLLGQIPTERLLCADPASRLAALRGDPPIEVHPLDNAETVALLAVERHDADVAVVDSRRKLLGAIPIGPLLALLHEEHVDNFLRMGGVGKTHPVPISDPSTMSAFRARIPWLVLGLAGGLLAGGVAAWFEVALKQEIALAFFLPLVVYMADAVGTQTETVLIRTLAYGKVPLGPQLLREGLVGLLIGGTIGTLAGACFLLFDGTDGNRRRRRRHTGGHGCGSDVYCQRVAIGVGSIGGRSGPASGPVATVLQDILSVAIYLTIATMILRW